MKLNKMEKIKPGMIVTVEWKDAMGASKADFEEIIDVPPRELLVATKTYGKVHSIDEEAIVILQEDSAHQGDYTVVPFGMITDIHILDSKNVKGGKKKK